ncbi:MAG: alpha/beta hydrolase [Ferruginibacter sp.]
MKRTVYSRTKVLLFACLNLAAVFLIGLDQSADAQVSPGKVKNIVIVHGAFADGSGFLDIYRILTKKGYHVTIVQLPLTSFEEDVAATNRELERQDGPAILVGHSWGGTVITQAGASAKVAGLVYIEGFQPEVGETTLDLATSAPTAPEYGILPPDSKGLLYYSKEKYHAGFAGDLPKETADFMYATQGPFPVKSFTTKVTQAAWKTKPSWAIVSSDDKSINPIILKRMYKRAGSVVTEIKASHVVFMSQPQKVAAVIEAAAMGSLK